MNATTIIPSAVLVTNDTVTGQCHGCGVTQEFARVLFDGRPLLAQHWCSSCVQAKMEAANDACDEGTCRDVAKNAWYHAQEERDRLRGALEDIAAATCAA